MNPKTQHEVLDWLYEQGFLDRLPRLEDQPNPRHETRSRVHREVYPKKKPMRRWVFVPNGIQSRIVKPASEIAALVDNRSVDELADQAQDALKQLQFRAHTGDQKAILLFANTLRLGVGALNVLAEKHPEKVRSHAEKQPQWPVLVSLNPQDIKRAKEQLRSLGVGQKADTPTRRNQRVDFGNFWTQLARRALTRCQDNKIIIPMLKSHGSEARTKRKQQRFWGATVGATCYFLSSGDLMVITDWQQKCAKLSEPITSANFKTWWAVVHDCVLDHWQTHEGNYAEALRQIGQPAEKESRRRGMALDRVKQALKSLTDIQ